MTAWRRLSKCVAVAKTLAFYIALTTLFTTFEEYLTVRVLKNDLGAYIFTLIVVFPVWATLSYSGGKIIDGLVARESKRELVHFLSFGFIGLMFEWFAMGLAPWSNPSANPVGMLLFQTTMFTFWGLAAHAPRLFAARGALARCTRRWILGVYIPLFVFTYVVGLSASESSRHGVIILMIMATYLTVAAILAWHFRQLFTSETTIESLQEERVDVVGPTGG